MNLEIKLSVKVYAKWVSNYMENHWDGYLLTFMFRQLSGSRASVLRQMERELERVYARALTRIVRKPRCEAAQGQLPILLGSPDFPVPKAQKQSLGDVTLNDGLHVHALALIPPGSRMREGLHQHFAAGQPSYIRPGFPLLRLHAQPISHDPGYVAEYALKSVIRGRVSLDDIIVLPRGRSQLPRVSERVPGQFHALD